MRYLSNLGLRCANLKIVVLDLPLVEIVMLDISSNNVSDDGFCCLCYALAKLRSIRILKAQMNNITDVGMGTFINSVSPNSSLERAILYDNPISEATKAKLKALNIAILV